MELEAEPARHRGLVRLGAADRPTRRSSAPGRCTSGCDSSTPDVDLQATVSEVRPDGKETFVQNGWIRADERKLVDRPDNMFKQPSTLLEPVPS